jgi:hypothetical protein
MILPYAATSKNGLQILLYLRWLFQLPEMLRPDLGVSKVCIIIVCLSHRWVYYLPLVLWWWNPQSVPLLTERFTRLTCIQQQVCVCVCERWFFQPTKTFNICVVLGWFKVACFLAKFSFCSHNNHPILYKETLRMYELSLDETIVIHVLECSAILSKNQLVVNELSKWF